jgi:hypothetical protein
LDENDLLVGQGPRVPVTDATSDTTAVTIPGYGFTSVDSTTDDTWLLGPPVKGAAKTLYSGSTSTGIRTIIRNSADFAIRTSASSSQTTIAWQAGGQTVQLFGVSSDIYALVSRPASTEFAMNGTT